MPTRCVHAAQARRSTGSERVCVCVCELVDVQWRGGEVDLVHQRYDSDSTRYHTDHQAQQEPAAAQPAGSLSHEVFFSLILRPNKAVGRAICCCSATCCAHVQPSIRQASGDVAHITPTCVRCSRNGSCGGACLRSFVFVVFSVIICKAGRRKR